MYQIKILYTLNLYKVICQLFQEKKDKQFKK